MYIYYDSGYKDKVKPEIVSVSGSLKEKTFNANSHCNKMLNISSSINNININLTFLGD